MKKYAVIGNPVEHSLSPKLHNYWIKKHKINAFYEKYLLKENDLKDIISKIKSGKLEGINITVPFKKSIIPFVDLLSQEANETQSVNTIILTDDILVGHNTDILGFQNSIKDLNYNFEGKKVVAPMLELINHSPKSQPILISEKGSNPIFLLSNKMKLFHVESKKFIGGRYSVLSEVGLLPAYIMGLNISN